MEYQETKQKLIDGYESKLGKLTDETSSKIEHLQQKLKIADDELTMLGEFKQIKELVEKKFCGKLSKLFNRHHTKTMTSKLCSTLVPL